MGLTSHPELAEKAKVSRQQRAEIYALNAIATRIEEEKFQQFLANRPALMSHSKVLCEAGSDSEDDADT